ncbi:MAG: carboxypeptidase M32, partial [Proteobacteria bacterium]|nr:carboxypeptidase M32 [Pseudomonadota bacterium]
IIEALGLGRHNGRIDTSHHPFTGGVPDDVRITTRYNEADFTDSIMGAVHETGHALYERGLPPAWRHQPVGQSRGMTLHESQSLLFEMHAARSPEFVSFLAPLAREILGCEGPAYDVENLQRVYLWVEPGLIRVDADEVTYPAHIIHRYRLERALLQDDLRVSDLPGAWNEGLKRLIGIAPPDDRDGCMQDIHWYGGDFGYFPTYTLGALAAAQFFAAARAQLPQIPSEIALGDFSSLRTWLGENIHSKAALADTQSLISQATGSRLGVDAFKQHLTRRYLNG